LAIKVELCFLTLLLCFNNFFLDFISYSFLSPSKVISSQLNKWGYFIFNIHLFPRIFFIVLLRWRFNVRNCFWNFVRLTELFFMELFLLSWLFYCAILMRFVWSFLESFFPELFLYLDYMNLRGWIWSFSRELFLKIGQKTVIFPITTNSSQIFFWVAISSTAIFHNNKRIRTNNTNKNHNL
jgi:hypothetical protein